MPRKLTSDQAMQVMADQIEKLVLKGITNMRLVTDDNKVIMVYFVRGEDLEVPTEEVEDINIVDPPEET